MNCAAAMKMAVTQIVRSTVTVVAVTPRYAVKAFLGSKETE